MTTDSTRGLMRLLQVTDSSFPVGGYAYSHGLEWLAHERVVSGEAGLNALLQAYVDQSVAGQSLPAAIRAMRTTTLAGVIRADFALDASFGSAAERDAGRAMGERLLTEAAHAFGGVDSEALLHAVRNRATPGQYAVAFAMVARAERVNEEAMAHALAYAMASSVAQAAVRLGLTGQTGAARLVADACRRAETEVERICSARSLKRPGAFTPALDVAGALHPTLPFRMFAS